MDGGQRRFDHTAQREVIKSDDSDILGDPVSAFFESLYGAYGDQIIVCEIAGSQFFSVLMSSIMSAYAPSIEGVSLWTMEREEDIPAARTAL